MTDEVDDFARAVLDDLHRRRKIGAACHFVPQSFADFVRQDRGEVCVTPGTAGLDPDKGEGEAR